MNGMKRMILAVVLASAMIAASLQPVAVSASEGGIRNETSSAAEEEGQIRDDFPSAQETAAPASGAEEETGTEAGSPDTSDTLTEAAEAPVEAETAAPASADGEDEELLPAGDDGYWHLDANGGKFPDGETTKFAYYNEYGYIGGYSDEYRPVREGYVFLGWFAEASCVTLLSDDEDPYSNYYDISVEKLPAPGTTIYAGWTDSFHTVTYVFDGVNAPFDTGYYWPDGVDYGDKKRLKKLEVKIPSGKKLSYSNGIFKPDFNKVRNTDYHYSLDGWYDDPGRTSDKISDSDLYDMIPDSNVTYYAGYRKNKYVVTLKSSDGEAFFDRECYDYEEKNLGFVYETTACRVDATGYSSFYPSNIDGRYIKHNNPRMKFKGWFRDKNCTVPVSDDGKPVTVTDDVEFYAGWENVYKLLLLDPNGGYFLNEKKDAVSRDPLGFSIWTDEEMYFSDSGTILNEDLHLRFAGWAETKDAKTPKYPYEGNYFTPYISLSATLDPSKDTTLYAVWEEDFFKVVTYDARGGVVTTEWERDEKFASPYRVQQAWKDGESGGKVYPGNFVAERDGKVFAGWHYDQECKRPASDFTISQDVTLYAKWMDIHTVTFDLGAGKVDGASSCTLDVTDNKSIRQMGLDMPADPVPDDPGSAFAGWFRDPARTKGITRSGIMDLAVTDDVTFYAGYADACSVTFNANGGRFASVSDSDTWTVRVPVGGTVNGRYPTVVNDNERKVFGGWFTDPGCTREVENVHDLTVNGDMTLFAGFADCYIVTFDANHSGAKLDGSEAPVKVKVRKGEPFRCGADGSEADLIDNEPELDYSAVTDMLPRRQNYFDYILWNTEKDGSGKEYTFYSYEDHKNHFSNKPTGFVPTGDITLYIVWNEAVSVTFDSNGVGYFREGEEEDRKYGKLTEDKKCRVLMVPKGIPFGKISTPWLDSVDGYSIYPVWYDDPQGKTRHEYGPVNENIRIYAYNSSRSSNSVRMNGETEEPVPAPEKDLFTPAGDSDSNVTFHAGDGFFGSPEKKTDSGVNDSDHALSCKIPEIDDPELGFSGWYYDEELTRPVPRERQWLGSYESVCLDLPSSVKDLYAGYDRVFTVTLSANGGYFDLGPDRIKDPSVSMREDTAISVKNRYLPYGARINDISLRVRRDGNKIFDGWYYDAEGTRKAVLTCHTDNEVYEYYEYLKPDRDVTLYAKWVDHTLPDSISVTPDTTSPIALKVGEELRLKATVEPSSAAAGKQVHWYIRENMFEISENNYLGWEYAGKLTDDGLVTALRRGDMSVYAELNGVVSKQLSISVTDDGQSDPDDPYVGERSGLDPEPEVITTPGSGKASIYLVKGQSYVAGAGTWTSDDKSVASVDKKGKITGKGKGKTVVRNSAAGLGGISEYQVTVSEPSVYIGSQGNTKASLLIGSTVQASVGGLGDASDHYPRAWTTSNGAVATVEDGLVTAVGKGSAKISAVIGGKSYTCSVKVEEAVTDKQTKDFDGKTVRLVPLQTMALKFNNASFTCKDSSWESSLSMNVLKDKKDRVTGYADGVVYVTKAGKLTAIGAGSSELTGTDRQGRKVSLKVVVSEPAERTLFLVPGKKATIGYYQVKNKNATDWSSSNTAVSMGDNGKVTAASSIPQGESQMSRVTCTYNPYSDPQYKTSGFKFTTLVYVENPALTVDSKLKNDTKPGNYVLELNRGEKYDGLKVTGLVQQAIFMSSKKNVAFVDENGMVYARSSGKAKISMKIKGRAINVNVIVR